MKRLNNKLDIIEHLDVLTPTSTPALTSSSTPTSTSTPTPASEPESKKAPIGAILTATIVSIIVIIILLYLVNQYFVDAKTAKGSKLYSDDAGYYYFY